VPDLEVDMFKSLDAVGGVVAEDEAMAGLDDKTREKLIAQDKLKAEKVKDTLEKTRLKEVQRKKKQDDTAKEKAENGKDKIEKGKDKKTMCRMRSPPQFWMRFCSLSLHPTGAPSGTPLTSLSPKSVLPSALLLWT
jgi:hypothetical protein